MNVVAHQAMAGDSQSTPTEYEQFFCKQAMDNHDYSPLAEEEARNVCFATFMKNESFRGAVTLVGCRGMAANKAIEKTKIQGKQFELTNLAKALKVKCPDVPGGVAKAMANMAAFLKAYKASPAGKWKRRTSVQN